MRLYDCEQSAQEDIVDSGQEEAPTKTFEGFVKQAATTFDEFKF